MSLSDPEPLEPLEPLDVLHRRLLQAEREAWGIIRDMGAVGVPGEEDTVQRDLLGRVSRMESLLQTLRLTLFRLETERQLEPTHSGAERVLYHYMT